MVVVNFSTERLHINIYNQNFSMLNIKSNKEMIPYMCTHTHIHTVTAFILFAKLLPHRVKGQTNQTEISYSWRKTLQRKCLK